jgi:hypothetical protein
MSITSRKEQFLLHLMARIILAGGIEIRPDELREMKLGKLMDMIYPNMIELTSYKVDNVEFDLDKEDWFS